MNGTLFLTPNAATWAKHQLSTAWWNEQLAYWLYPVMTLFTQRFIICSP